MRLSFSLLAATALCLPLAAQRTTLLTSAPKVGTTLNITYTSDPADVYIMFVSDRTTGSMMVPGIGGTFFLDTATLLVLHTGTVGAAGTDTKGVFIPNDPILLGVGFDLQPLNWSPVVAFGADKVAGTVVAGVGTSVFADGSITATVGFDMVRVQNADMGNPTAQNTFMYHPQVIQVIGPEGWVQGFTSTFTGTAYHCDPGVLKGDRVARDMRQNRFQSIALPNGYNFAVARDSSNVGQFVALSINQTTGAVVELSGSRMASASTAATPTNAYTNLWGFSPDGNVAVGVVWRGLNTNAPPDPDDAVVLIRTDGSTWPGTGTSTLDISPAVAAQPQWFDGNVIVANEVVFVRGSQDTFWAPLDGSARLAPVPLPNTGTNQSNAWIYSRSFRVSRDGRTVVLPIGGDSSNSALEHDIVAITNIDRTGNFTVRNITGFSTATTIQRFFGDSRAGATAMNASLSPDGRLLAFFTGGGTAANPDLLHIAPTDGSGAGSLAPVAGFPAGLNAMGTPHWLPNGDLTVFAGTGTTALDVYRVSPGMPPTVTNLTNKGDLNVPFTLVSDNGLNLYFARGFTSTATSLARNLVAILPTGALRDITGSEFSSGTGPDIELQTTHANNEFRLAPNASGEVYFHAAPARTVSTVFTDYNVYKFDFEAATEAVAVTNHTGTGASTAIVRIDNLNVLSDGSVAWVQGLGTQLSTRPRTVFYLPATPAAVPIDLSEHAQGWGVLPGSLRVVEGPIGGAYWVQADATLGNTNAIGYFATLDGAMQGNPLNLTGAPVAGTVRNIATMATGPANP